MIDKEDTEHRDEPVGYRVVMQERDMVLLTPCDDRLKLDDVAAMTWVADVLNDYDAVVVAACEAASRIEAFLRARSLGYDATAELEAALDAINATGIRRQVNLPVAILTDAQILKLRKALFGNSAAAGLSPSSRPAANCGGGAA